MILFSSMTARQHNELPECIF